MIPFGLKPIPKSVACLMCGGLMSLGKTIGSRRNCDYAWCSDCDFAQIYPMPTEEEVLKYYASGHYREDTHHGGRDSKPDEHNFNEEQKRAEGWIPHIDLPVERHLDIGSSVGKVLEVIGAEVQVGVEPGPWGRKYGAFESLDEVEGGFDLITCLHTIEHVISPFEMLERIRSLAIGQVCIEVPKPPGWGWPHLVCFRNKSLLKAMEDSGMPAKIVDDAFHIKVKHETIR